MLGAGAMTDISLSILPEKRDDAMAIERLYERTFGPGRHAKTSYRLREQVAHCLTCRSPRISARCSSWLVAVAGASVRPRRRCSGR
jgi:hypothetical protein